MKTFRSSPIKFNESTYIGPDGISDNIQILRVGNFFHQGELIQVTKQDLEKIIFNFKENIRGIDLMLDYSHDSHKKAAAWFQDLYLAEEGQELWGKVEWTEGGSESVRKKEYRYISADFSFEYKDNETLINHGPTLLGAGLTNRPVVKKMTPTILSETNIKKGSIMDFEQLVAAFEALKLKVEELVKEDISEKDPMIDDSMMNEKVLSEEKLKEREIAVEKKENDIKLAEEKNIKDAEIEVKKNNFDVMLSEGRTVEAQRNAFMENNMPEFIKNAGNVNLSEIGSGNVKTKSFAASKTPAQDEVISLSEKIMEKDGSNLRDAMREVLSENKELKAKYEIEVNL